MLVDIVLLTSLVFHDRKEEEEDQNNAVYKVTDGLLLLLLLLSCCLWNEPKNVFGTIADEFEALLQQKACQHQQVGQLCQYKE